MVFTIVKPCDYNLDSLTFYQIANSKKKTMQINLIPAYEGDRSPVIQLPPIDLDMYGVPSKCEMYKEDRQRMFLRLPLDQSNNEVKDLTEGFLKKLDEKFGSKEFQDEALAPIKNVKYSYQPLVKTSLDEGKHPFIKVKLLTEYPSNQILTGVIEECGDKHRSLKPDTQTIDGFAKYFPLRTNLTCMIVPCKLWIHPVNASESYYGVMFKLIKVLVKLPVGRALKDAMDDNLDFLND